MQEIDKIYLSWYSLSKGNWGTPINLKEVALNMGLPLENILKIFEDIKGYHNTYELIPSRGKNYKVGNRRAACITFYENWLENK